jgi:hypothetical protein
MSVVGGTEGWEFMVNHLEGGDVGYLTPELMEQLNRLEGLTDSVSCQTLFHLATMVPVNQAIVELGVYTARSVCWLGAGARAAGVVGGVWGIDLWDIHTNRVRHNRGTPAQDPTVRRLAKRQVAEMDLEGIVTLIRDFTVDYAVRYTGPKVGLLYVDANHSRDAVLADVGAWYNHLADDAVIVFDDYCQGRPMGVDGVGRESSDGDTITWEYSKGRVRDAVKILEKEGMIVDVAESASRFAVCRKGK